MTFVHTDSFFFDGDANLQKAGRILCANFPQAMCFHGGEHVLSLFFSDLSRLGAIKVRMKKNHCIFWVKARVRVRVRVSS